ncbi:type I-E CRISPR-associated endonuclease Cas1e [Acrocarpospora catenulata]|uniref:type I-E CRISPR-associated endonuclease Cas1e n=1 Tax=Acrocarpospora catenulata TaxID=2836182 RepID=UPI001BD9404E|nr:type I-E CRISPR-associated endonuclease Cas1e [Acrocarpospora catenulata]
MLPRIADSLSFLYLETVRIVQDDTGVCAQVDSPRGVERVYLPTASLSCALLGPGTSITQPALATFARHGTTLVCVGAGGVRSYAGILPAQLTTDWLEHQARAWADEGERLRVAVRMYEHRFGPASVPAGTSLAQLRGLEGQRVKALYRLLATKHGIARFRRNYDPAAWDDQDPVNLALSASNAALYGVVHAAICALGCSPALGFIHAGTQTSFVYDIADLYKAKVTIPLAFSLAGSTQPEREARVRLREEFRLIKLMPTIVSDIQKVIAPTAAAQPPTAQTADIVHLWDPDLGSLPAGVNYADEAVGGADIPW